uniref:Uncharacterized protein n=1 Tax=Arundo donax TaxID=35708 RepID=A0A0A9ACY8_ARUDO
MEEIIVLVCDMEHLSTCLRLPHVPRMEPLELD